MHTQTTHSLETTPLSVPIARGHHAPSSSSSHPSPSTPISSRSTSGSSASRSSARASSGGARPHLHPASRRLDQHFVQQLRGQLRERLGGNHAGKVAEDVVQAPPPQIPRIAGIGRREHNRDVSCRDALEHGVLALALQGVEEVLVGDGEEVHGEGQVFHA